MTRRPRLLDLYCCEGGAAVGYHRAGFDVVGVDFQPQRRYPYEFHQADALQYLVDHVCEFDAVHASPPCQAYSITRHSHSKEHPDLVGSTRDALAATGLPYVIENVVGAPLVDPLTLCGSEFGLTATDVDGTPLALRRHRLFESNVFLLGAGGCRHDPKVQVGGVYGGGMSDRMKSVERFKAIGSQRGGYTPAKSVRAALLGINHDMTLHGLSQSIPPAYTEHVGRQVLVHLARG